MSSQQKTCQADFLILETPSLHYVKWKKRGASTSLQTALWCVLSGLIVFGVLDLSVGTSTLQINLFKPSYLFLMRWIQSLFYLELWFVMLYGRPRIKLNLKACLLMLIASSKKFPTLSQSTRDSRPHQSKPKHHIIQMYGLNLSDLKLKLMQMLLAILGEQPQLLLRGIREGRWYSLTRKE